MARPRRPSASSDVSSHPSTHEPVELGSSYDYLAKVILLGPSGAGKSCLLHRFVNSSWRVLSSQTIGVEFSSKIVKIGSGPSRRRIKLQLWDTAGTERFRSVSRSYYRGAAGAILVYDVASLASFNALPTFLMDARALASPNLTVIMAGNKADLAEPGGKQQQGNGSVGEQIPPSRPSSTSSKQSAMPFDTGGTTGSARSRGESLSLTAGTRWTATMSSEGREVMPDFASRWASKSGVPVTMDVSALTGDNVDELFNRLARMILTKIELGEIDPDDPQSGIQYGDAGWDGASIKSGTTFDDGTLRRRKKKGKVLLNGISEWGDVFRSPASRGGRGCQC